MPPRSSMTSTISRAPTAVRTSKPTSLSSRCSIHTNRSIIRYPRNNHYRPCPGGRKWTPGGLAHQLRPSFLNLTSIGHRPPTGAGALLVFFTYNEHGLILSVKWAQESGWLELEECWRRQVEGRTKCSRLLVQQIRIGRI